MQIIDNGELLDMGVWMFIPTINTIHLLHRLNIIDEFIFPRVDLKWVHQFTEPFYLFDEYCSPGTYTFDVSSLRYSMVITRIS